MRVVGGSSALADFARPWLNDLSGAVVGLALAIPINLVASSLGITWTWIALPALVVVAALARIARNRLRRRPTSPARRAPCTAPTDIVIVGAEEAEAGWDAAALTDREWAIARWRGRVRPVHDPDQALRRAQDRAAELCRRWPPISDRLAVTVFAGPGGAVVAGPAGVALVDGFDGRLWST